MKPAFELVSTVVANKRMPEISRTNGREDPLVMKKPFSHAAFAEVARKYSSR